MFQYFSKGHPLCPCAALSYTGNCPFCIKDRVESSSCDISELWRNLIPFPIGLCCSQNVLWLFSKLIVVKIMWVTFHGIELANKTLSWPDGGPRYRARLPTVILCYFPRESGLLGCFLLRLECLSLVFLPTGLRDINFSLEKGEGQRNQDFFFFFLQLLRSYLSTCSVYLWEPRIVHSS